MVACRVSSWSSHFNRDQLCPERQTRLLTLRFSSSYVSIVTFRPATSSSLPNRASLSLSASASNNHQHLSNLYESAAYHWHPVTSAAASHDSPAPYSVAAADAAFPIRATQCESINTFVPRKASTVTYRTNLRSQLCFPRPTLLLLPPLSRQLCARSVQGFLQIR